MEFFGRVVDSFSTAGQGVAKKAKNTTESIKLNNQIKMNERMIEKLLCQVGKCYFEEFKDKEIDEKYKDFFQELLRLESENQKLKEELEGLTAEKICPNCGKSNEMDVNFCVNCGTSLKDLIAESSNVEGIVCSRCSAVNSDEALFCVECGNKLENE